MGLIRRGSSYLVCPHFFYLILPFTIYIEDFFVQKRREAEQEQKKQEEERKEDLELARTMFAAARRESYYGHRVD